MLLGAGAVGGCSVKYERRWVVSSSGVDGWHAEGQGTRLDLGIEDGGLADHVAVELVVVFSVELGSRTLFAVCWSTWSSFLARRVISQC